MLDIVAKKCRYDIVRMISGAGSGHIGGSLSSVDIYISILDVMTENDRLVVSHGHSAAAVYAALGNMGYFDVEDAVKTFRRQAPYEGHPSIAVNGVEWCSGSLGQGLSVGCGFALAKKLQKEPGRVFVVMGDGEQQKGQLQEAREFAIKYNLDNLIAVIDCNGLQACGEIAKTTGQCLSDKYRVSGWEVVTADGHSFEDMKRVLKGGSSPFCILARTVMGKGIAEIENDYRYHGTVISEELKNSALKRLRLTTGEQKAVDGIKPRTQRTYESPKISCTSGRTYDSVSDIRSAMGNALADIAKENPDIGIVAFDCDLEGSVKLTDFKKLRPDAFIECGIAEHNAATVAAAVAKSGMIAIHADFSMFNIAETYSQNRMADINKSPIKLFCTHAGLDVGEDGKTHQCIDYLSLLSNLYGFKVVVPADANQADAAVRYALSVPYPVAVIGGRSKMPILTDADGNTLGFKYGKGQWLRRGSCGVIITYGNMAHKAVSASDLLLKDGIHVGVLNLPSPLDFDDADILKAAQSGRIIIYEDHNTRSGIGGEIAKIICNSNIRCELKCLGINCYGSSTAPEFLYKEQGLDIKSLINKIKE